MELPSDASETETTSGNASAVQKIRPVLPSFHTRAMRKQFLNDFSLFRCVRPPIMREMYHRLTGMYQVHSTNVCVQDYNVM
jgi:hypothetical protein